MFKFARFLSLSILLALPSCGKPVRTDSPAVLYPDRIVTLPEKQDEAATKLDRLLSLLKRESLSGVVILAPANFAWITAGADTDGIGEAAASFLFVREDGRKFFICAEREPYQSWVADLRELGFEPRYIPWYAAEPNSAQTGEVLRELAAGRPFGSDVPCPGARTIGEEMTALRVPLTETEIRKYRWLGRKCAEAVESVCRQIEPGMTDLGIEALLCDALRRQAILPAGTNVRTDGVVEDVNQQPRRDVKRVEKYAELEVAARAWGLTVAVARHIHFGPVPEELQKKANAAARINAGCWARTEPGVAAGSILVGAISDYADTGFLDGWRQRDLGGAIGYRTRDWLASPGSARILQSSAAYVWNPAVDGFTMEDTVLLIDDRLEILTETSGWPIIESKALGKIYRAPGILVR